jgi:hypothetical protein
MPEGCTPPVARRVLHRCTGAVRPRDVDRSSESYMNGQCDSTTKQRGIATHLRPPVGESTAGAAAVD